MPSSTPPSPTSHALTHRHGAREAHAKQALNGEHENVQRFRALMDGKQRSSEDAAQHAADEQSAVDIDVDSGANTQDADANELPPDQEQALRDLLQRQLSEGRAQSPVLASRDQDSSSDSQQDDHRGDGQAGANIGLQALHMAQQSIVQDAQQPAPSHAAMAPALAELIERHVKQLLVPDATSRSAAQAREIMITLKDGLLPGTELWLSRTSNGWKLRADTRSSTAYRSLLEGAPQLIERFAQSQLGTLEISPTLLA
ncbi:type III secretion HpaP family protein [Dyella sp.]|uniref:type III secretion HpaP family protein n=1 Tax=Dyella sp. TaxID=1869338 RepID=UPI002D7998A7|nr:type III secretion HpaP family protein [Dyella sp.]HET7333180.1 type III secretion HpaP family protein [Dyella sp.]